MSRIDRFDPDLADRSIITRSDRAPTTYERYGNWARKFFGYGWHEACRDERTALATAHGAQSGAPPLR